ncbi:MAG: ABC transporter substrate-binding protein [Geitlerinemataceae cyanobacterium]
MTIWKCEERLDRRRCSSNSIVLIAGSTNPATLSIIYMNFLKRKTLLFLFAIPLLATVFIHGGRAEDQLKTLKIGLNQWPGFDVILYAQETDIFQKRGLEVEFVQFENLQDIARAVMRGSLDAGSVTVWDALQADPGNDSPAFLLVSDISNGSDGIVARSNIQSVADLKGKRIGAKLGTVNHLVLLEALQYYQIQPHAVEIVDISNEEAVKKLELGELDAAVVWEPLLSDTAKSIQGNIIYTTREIESLVIDGFMSSASSRQRKEAELQQFILAWFDVMHAIETQPVEVFSVVGKQYGLSVEAFAEDYAGLQKGDLATNKEMFVRGGLKWATRRLEAMLHEDTRHGRIVRDDLTIDSELSVKAIQRWKLSEL